MKAIYINLDPYLQAVADWRNANPFDGDTGTYPTPPPSFFPLPVAVTIPLGESAAIYKLVEKDGEDWMLETFTIDGVEISVIAVSSSDPLPGESGVIATNSVPGLSALTPSAKYGVFSVSGNTSLEVSLSLDGNDDLVQFTVPVLVRREQASGPVDLVDFTPPASSIAAGTDLKGTKFDGNEIVAAAGTGALSAPAGA